MPKYQVFLRGENIRLELGAKVASCGFYTTRFVEADSPESAELAAVDLIRNDLRLRSLVKNDSANPPMIYLESLSELETFDGVQLPGTGFTFFDMDGVDDDGS